MAASFCWHCGGKLSISTITGALIYQTYVDPIGNEHRVHKSCKGEKSLTAAPTPSVDDKRHRRGEGQ